MDICWFPAYRDRLGPGDSCRLPPWEVFVIPGAILATLQSQPGIRGTCKDSGPRGWPEQCGGPGLHPSGQNCPCSRLPTCSRVGPPWPRVRDGQPPSGFWSWF